MRGLRSRYRILPSCCGQKGRSINKLRFREVLSLALILCGPMGQLSKALGVRTKFWLKTVSALSCQDYYRFKLLLRLWAWL